MSPFFSLFKAVCFFGILFFVQISCISLSPFYKASPFPVKTSAKTTSKDKEKTWKDIKTQKTNLEEISRFIESNRDQEIALEAYLLKAKIFLKQKKEKKACETYHQVVQSDFYYSNSLEAYEASAKCHFKSGRFNEAFNALDRVIQNPKENLVNQKKAALLQREFLKSEKGFITKKLKNLNSLFFLSSQNPKIWKSEGKRIIDALSGPELISQWEKKEDFPIFEGYFLYKIGQYFWDNKSINKSKRFFKKALHTSLEPNLKQKAIEMLKLIEPISKINPYLIGVLLPLSGRRQVLGEKILKGLVLGLDMEEDSSWQIVVRDSKSHPDVVEAHMEELFYKHHVVGFLGGLTSDTAEVMAEMAEQFLTPAILFSQKQKITLDRDFVFQNSITAKELLTPLVKQFRDRIPFQKAAILYPDDVYGRSYAKLFYQVFTENKGDIIHQESYKLGEVDFKNQVKNLLQLNIKERREEFEKLKSKYLEENPLLTERSPKLIPENLLPVKKEFDVLFMPDSIHQVVKVIDHFKYFGVQNLYILGTNLWSAEKISSDLKGFSFAFVNLSKKEERLVRQTPFYKKFVKLFAEPPGFFEQRAYNSALFFKKGLIQGVQSRISFQKELEKIKEFQGAYNKIILSKDRVFSYPLSLYVLFPGQKQSLNPIPVQ